VPAPMVGAAPFLWPGGMPAAPLGALLAAAGVPLGVAAGAWLGLTGATGDASNTRSDGAAHGAASCRGVPAASVAGAWPGLAGAAGGTSSTGPDGVAPGAAASGSMMGEAASIPGHGGWPEFLATATTALVTSCVITRATPTVSNETASQEVRPCARRMERFEVPTDYPRPRASTVRRRGGRTSRLPPAARNATATASVDVDLTDSRYELLLLLH
jgi:hypothetical protein